MENNLSGLPPELVGQAPKGKRNFVVSKRAVILYFGVFAILLAYMGYTAMRLDVSPSVQCGAYSVSDIAHAEITYAWAFVHPYSNVTAYVAHICSGLQKSYGLELPS
jgi:hypothetical protein